MGLTRDTLVTLGQVCSFNPTLQVCLQQGWRPPRLSGGSSGARTFLITTMVQLLSWFSYGVNPSYSSDARACSFGLTRGNPTIFRVNPKPSWVNLYTILQCTILYGAWRESGGSEGGRILQISIAIVLQPCGRCRWERQ